ncbi:MAG: CHRD domain-containing protein, partial [Phycisphaeraceae bacterium]
MDASAQADDTFRARLSPMPVTPATVNSITGVGDVTARLNGGQLVLEGRFRGMSSAATAAHIHVGAPARPGPVAHPLQITGAADGEIRGTVQLTDQQIETLRNESLYVQVHSEQNPGGELRGWIFPVSVIGATPTNFEPPRYAAIENFVPVTDAMLRDPAPGDWPMIRRNFQAWSYSPLD